MDKSTMPPPLPSSAVTGAIAVERGEDVHQAFMQALPDGFWINDFSGRFLETNEALCQMLGYTREELLHMNIQDIEASETPGETAAHIQEIIRTGSGRFQTRHRRKDGVVMGVEVSALYTAKLGKRFFVILRDITERKLMEKALLIQNRISNIFLTVSGDEMFNEALKIVLEELRSPYGVFGYLDQGGNLVVPSMTRHIWDKCQVTDKSLFFPRSTWGDSSWPRAIREKKWNYTNEVSARIPKGHIGISRHISFPILFQGKVIGLFQVANKGTDYTEEDIRMLENIAGYVAPILNVELQRKWAEEELRESEKRFRTTFEQAAVGIAHVGTDGRWLRVNQKLCDIVGYTREELLARSFQDITHADDIESDLEYVRQLLAATIPTYSMEKRYLHKNGEIVWINLTVALVRKDSGEPDYFISVIQDISVRKRMEQEIQQLNAELEQRVIQRTAQLQAANADLENFSYSVSHDLRAPLRAIDGFASILREDYASRLDEEGLRLFQVVSDNTRKMAQLIDDILAFSCAGRSELNLTTLDMNALVQQVWQELEPQRAERAIELRLPPLPSARGDHAAVRQVWMNLLANAVKFTRGREPAVIEVGGRHEGEENIYSIRDNGVGFDMAYVAKLFGLFQRLHGMEEFAGTGVGLSIVKRFITKHGGRVWAEGKTGEGATFWFTLPAETIAESGLRNAETTNTVPHS